jgi:hypothetical protein
MKRLSALIVIGLLAALAGCGGDDSIAPEVPGPPAAVVPAESGDSPTEAAANAQSNSNDSSTSSNDTSSSSDSSTSTDTGSTDTGTTDTGTTDTGMTGDTSGGTAAPDTGEDSASNDTAPPAGSDAQQFEDFCAQNAGAC